MEYNKKNICVLMFLCFFMNDYTNCAEHVINGNFGSWLFDINSITNVEITYAGRTIKISDPEKIHVLKNALRGTVRPAFVSNMAMLEAATPTVIKIKMYNKDKLAITIYGDELGFHLTAGAKLADVFWGNKFASFIATACGLKSNFFHPIFGEFESGTVEQ